MSLPFTQLAEGRRLFRISGIAIQVSMSFLPLALFLMLALSPMAGGPLGGLFLVVFLALSILLHELGHALTARVFGISCPSITLHLLGGVARLSAEAKRPSHEILIAAAGPAVSLLLAGTFFSVGLLFQDLTVAGAGLFYYLGFANLILALFNLLPGLPLDGGRILRGALWAAKKDRRSATILAARAGEFVAYFIFFLAFLRLMSPVGGLAAAVFPALMGYFLLRAARQEGLMARLEGQQPTSNLSKLVLLFRDLQKAGAAAQNQSRSQTRPRQSFTGDEEVLQFGDGRELYIKRPAQDDGRDARHR